MSLNLAPGIVITLLLPECVITGQLVSSTSLRGPYTIMFGYRLKGANKGTVIGILISWTGNKAAIHTGQVLHLVKPRPVLGY
jgi:hypothetical protein